MFVKKIIHIGVIVQDIHHFHITDLFEFVVHTGGPASVTGTRKIAYINDVILTRHGLSADWFSVWPE